MEHSYDRRNLFLAGQEVEGGGREDNALPHILYDTSEAREVK